HIGWPHTFVDIGRRTAEALEPSIRRATALATGHSRGPSALTANMSKVVQCSDVFLRGYGGEIKIGRASCRERGERAVAGVASRRRHTRFSRDWSSDVCSSDLT